MTPNQLKAKLAALSSQPLSDYDVLQLLHEVVKDGGGLTIELDDVRYRFVVRDGQFSLKLIDKRRPSTIPPFR